MIEVIRFLEASGADCGEMSLLPLVVSGQVAFMGSDLVEPSACEPVKAHEAGGFGGQDTLIV